MQNTNISNFRKDLFTYVNQALEFNDIINVNTKGGNIIVMSEEEYNGIKETLYILSTPGMREALIAAKNEPGTELDWRKELTE